MPIDGYIDTVFASSGDLATVPDTIPGDGSVNYTSGYGVNYETPTGSGGLNIERAKFNQIMNSVTAALQQYQQHGVPPFITATMNGGTPYSYSKFDRVLLTGVVYKSLVNSNTDTPPSANWIIDPLNELNVSSVTGASYTYQASDTGKLIHRSNTGSAMSDTLPGTGSPLPTGWWCYVMVFDTPSSDAVNAGSGGAIYQGIVTGQPIIMEPGELYLLQSQGSGVYNAQRIATAVLHSAPPQGSFSNLAIAVSGTNTTSITVGGIVVQDSNKNTRKLSGLSLSYDAAVSGANGLDTGTIANNTWYNEFIIFNSTTNTSAALISLSATAPTLPSGYTYFARVGAVRYGSAALVVKLQYGRDVQYPTPIQLASGVATNSATSVSSVCPTTASKIKLVLSQISTSAAVVSGVAPNSAWNSLSPAWPIGAASAGTIPVNAVWEGEMILESTNVYYTGGASQTKLLTFGYTDNL